VKSSGNILMTVLIINRPNFVRLSDASGFLSSPLLFYETSIAPRCQCEWWRDTD